MSERTPPARLREYLAWRAEGGYRDDVNGCPLPPPRAVDVREQLNAVAEALLPHAGLGLRGGVEVPLSYHLAARLSGELVVNLVRPTLHLRGGQNLSAADTSKAGVLHIVASF